MRQSQNQSEQIDTSTFTNTNENPATTAVYEKFIIIKRDNCHDHTKCHSFVHICSNEKGYINNLQRIDHIKSDEWQFYQFESVIIDVNNLVQELDGDINQLIKVYLVFFTTKKLSKYAVQVSFHELIQSLLISSNKMLMVHFVMELRKKLKKKILENILPDQHNLEKILMHLSKELSIDDSYTKQQSNVVIDSDLMANMSGIDNGLRSEFSQIILEVMTKQARYLKSEVTPQKPDKKLNQRSGRAQNRTENIKNLQQSSSNNQHKQLNLSSEQIDTTIKVQKPVKSIYQVEYVQIYHQLANNLDDFMCSLVNTPLTELQFQCQLQKHFNSTLKDLIKTQNHGVKFTVQGARGQGRRSKSVEEQKVRQPIRDRSADDSDSEFQEEFDDEEGKEYVEKIETIVFFQAEDIVKAKNEILKKIRQEKDKANCKINQ
eukprot:403364551